MINFACFLNWCARGSKNKTVFLLFGKITKYIFISLVISFPALSSAADKFCATTGIYHCALNASSPDSSNLCGLNPISAIIRGVNTSHVQKSPPNTHGVWAYTPWHFKYSMSPNTAVRYGISQIDIYWERWDNPSWRPGVIIDSASVNVYNCKLCSSGTTLKLASGFSYCQADASAPPINNGVGPNNTCNPINISTGNKYYREEDYTDKNFSVVRSFNSASQRWTFNYRQKLYLHSLEDKALVNGSNGTVYYPHEVWAFREDGKVTKYTQNGIADLGYYAAFSQVQGALKLIKPEYNAVLSSNGGGFYLRDSSKFIIFKDGLPVVPDLGDTHSLTRNNVTERYDIRGRLTSVQLLGKEPTTVSYLNAVTTVTKADSHLAMEVDGRDRVIKIALPENSELNYLYSEIAGKENTLLSVTRTYGDGSKVTLRKYFYEDDRFPGYVTGIEDETSSRISSVKYDALGRAVSSERGPLDSGINRSQIQYDASGTRTLTNALGKKSTYHFTKINDEYKITKIEGLSSASCAGANQAYSYDTKGFVTSKTDWQGNITTYDYNDRGLEISRTEATGTPQARTTSTTWHATLNLPLTVTEPGRVTTYTYDTQGRQLSQTSASTAL